jgi:hypothetical protein
MGLAAPQQPGRPGLRCHLRTDDRTDISDALAAAHVHALQALAASMNRLAEAIEFHGRKRSRAYQRRATAIRDTSAPSAARSSVPAT